MSERRETRELVNMVARSIRREPDRWRESKGFERDDGLSVSTLCLYMSCSATIALRDQPSVYVSDGGKILSAKCWWWKRQRSIAAKQILIGLRSPQAQSE